MNTQPLNYLRDERNMCNVLKGGRAGSPLPAVADIGLSLLPPRLCVSAVMLTLISVSGFSQGYSIDWHKISGGGGTSTGGTYAVSGAIGQHDAGGAMTNGQYSATGGFWALPQAVQTEGAPTLTITSASPGYATVSWTPNTPGFLLQENLNVGTTNWVNSPSGTNNPAVVPATLPQKFYRLFKP